MCMAKYSNRPIGYFMEMPLSEFYAWVAVMNSEIKRETEEMKKASKKK